MSASVRLIHMQASRVIYIGTSKGCSSLIITGKGARGVAFRLRFFRRAFRGLRSGVFIHIKGDLVMGEECVCVVGVLRRLLILTNNNLYRRIEIGTSGRTLGRLGRRVRGKKECSS